MKNTNKIEDLGNGTHKVSISFDITEHGHSYGMPRNYNLSKIQKLIRSKSVQGAINNGYTICMYGHKARNKKQGYLAMEANEDTGSLQEPIGKITKMSIRDKIISYEMILVETLENKTKSVVKLISHNIGGFSAVWDVANGVLYGMDYILSPNFNGNRVVMDSICTDGSCQLDTAIRDTVLDAIGTHEELFDVAKDLLEHQDSVTEAMEFKGKIMVMQDTIANLQNKLEEKDIELDNQKITIKSQKESLEKADKLSEKKQTDAVANQVEPLQKEIAGLKEKEEKLSVLEDSIEASGLNVENGKVTLDSVALGNLFTPANKDKYTYDETTLDSLRKPTKQGADPMDAISMKY